jgi:hypothetical protein
MSNPFVKPQYLHLKSSLLIDLLRNIFMHNRSHLGRRLIRVHILNLSPCLQPTHESDYLLLQPLNLIFHRLKIAWWVLVNGSLFPFNKFSPPRKTKSRNGLLIKHSWRTYISNKICFWISAQRVFQQKSQLWVTIVDMLSLALRNLRKSVDNRS